MSDDELTARRVEQLEAAVRLLRDEMAELRAELRAERGAPPPRPVTPDMLAEGAPIARATGPTAPSARPRVSRGPERRRPTVEVKDLERLVGRYGTLALGALTILMAVGAFLGWAIANDLLRITAGVRVALGFVAAALIAGLGWRLRRRAGARFGNTLLALALAVVHVDAWGAGPVLGLFPQALALGVAALASAVLAAVALATGEEALFAVGFGGALAAPFVTSNGRGDVVALLAYGLVVIGLGLVVLRGRTWPVATRIAGLAGTVYALAGTLGDRGAASHLVHVAPTLFALLSAWLAMGVGVRGHRGGLARVYLGLAVVVHLAGTEWAGGVAASTWTLLALAGLATTYVATRFAPATREGTEPALVSTLLLPLGFLAAALAKVSDPTVGVRGALLALLWAGAAVLMFRVDRPKRANGHLAAALLASALSLLLELFHRDVACVVALSAHGALASRLVRRRRSSLLLLPALAVLAPTAAWTWVLLRDRTAWSYVPFATLPSLAGLAATLGWAAFAWHVARTEWEGPGPELVARRGLVRALGAIVGFLWVREELARAFSPDQATFTLIFYYALAGVVAISVGRLRGLSELRRWGLALAIYAAAKAVLQASALESIGFKVGSYVVVGCFLLAVAYWYRATADAAAPPPPSVEGASA